MRELLDRGARVHCLFVQDPKHRGPVVGLIRKYFAIVVRMHVVGPTVIGVVDISGFRISYMPLQP